MKKGWLKKYQKGGAISPEDAAISKVLMERNRDKNFVDRAYEISPIDEFGRPKKSIGPTIKTNTLPGTDMEGRPYSTYPGSYFLIYPIGASGSNISVGTWA